MRLAVRVRSKVRARMSERTTYEPGTFCWVELATTDVATATRFYTELFGWVARDLSPSGGGGPCTMLELAGRRVAALHDVAADAGSHWAGFVSVASVDESARAAERAGGTIVRAPYDIGQAGRTAVLADPSGARVHVWQPREHHGAAVVNEPGAFCWNELATHDTDACRAFYIAVFGWTSLTTQAEKAEYTTFTRDDAPLCGMLNVTADWPERDSDGNRTRPNWMTYFAVAECSDAAQRATELGGTLLVPPTHIPPVGRFAVIQDPRGAVFSIIELTDASV
jgi:uncharacterized protein